MGTLEQILIGAIAVFLPAVVIFLAVLILREHRPPSSTMVWILAIILLPYVGIPLYLIIGGYRFRRDRHRKPRLYDHPHLTTRELPGVVADDDRLRDLTDQLHAAGLPLPTGGNKVELVARGDEAFGRLVEMIRGAKRSIYVEMFILGRDNVGQAIVDELAAQAKDGVRVRLLLDGLGALFSQYRFSKPLRKAGGKVGTFSPIWPPRPGRTRHMHMRNHRKIIVVDEREAMVGGMNLAHEYMGPDHVASEWYDAMAAVRGPAVRDFLRIFDADWRFATKEDIEFETVPAPATGGEDAVQVLAGGPDAEFLPLHDMLVSAMRVARRRVWIATPYFVPSEPMMRQIRLLAEMGRDVRVVVPKVSNHRIPDMARNSYFRQLRGSKVRLFTYTGGMLHSKLMLIDEAVCVIGSANMDIRSLFFNFEAGALVYSRGVAQQVEATIQMYMDGSEAVDDRRPERESLALEIVEDIARLMAPLL
ncbi:MAG: cardiolipin synthase [Deltaproteobacteria bacterium]|nr:cardiolipin synthase [Deltaproteobacteria bacterium]